MRGCSELRERDGGYASAILESRFARTVVPRVTLRGSAPQRRHPCLRHECRGTVRAAAPELNGVGAELLSSCEGGLAFRSSPSQRALKVSCAARECTYGAPRFAVRSRSPGEPAGG